MQKSKKPEKNLPSSLTDFKAGFHYGNKRNLVSKDLNEVKKSSFQLKEEIQGPAKAQNPSLLSIFKNLFCCHQEKNAKSSPQKNLMKPQKKIIVTNNKSVKESEASIHLSSGPNQKSIDTTLIENLTQTSTTNNSNSNTQEMSSKANINTDPIIKENSYKITKSMLLEEDLFNCPLETLFILKKDVGICNLIAKIKFVDFFLSDTATNLCKKSLSNPNSNLCNKNVFNLMNFEKDSDFLSFKKESIERKSSANFKGKNSNTENNWTDCLKSKKQPDLDQQILFSFYEKNIILDYSHWKNVTPEQCAKHTAKRIRNRGIILDAFCGIGGNLIYFAKCNQVIGMDINQKNLRFAKHNSYNHGVFENVLFIQADYLEMNLQRFSPDVIFLNPEIAENCNKEKFSIFSDIAPDLITSLLKSFNICNNLILCLPKYAKINEIAELFSILFKRTDKKIEDITIEIEYFFINGELEQIQIYIGDIKQISFKEEVDFLYNYLCKGSYEKTFNYRDIRNFLKFLVKKLKLPKICFYLLKIDEINDCEHSLFQRFLNVLKIYQEISLEDQEKYFKSKNFLECNNENHSITKFKQDFEKEENIVNNFILKNSVDEKILTPSYYSGNIYTLSEEKKTKIQVDSFCCSNDENLWGESYYE